MKSPLRIALTSLFAVAAGATAFAGTVYEMDTTTYDGSEATTINSRLLVDGMDLKMEIAAAGGGAGDEVSGDMIFHGDENKMVGIDHARRAYFVMDEQALDQMAQSLKQMRDQFAMNPEMLKQLPPEAREALEKQGIKIPGMPQDDSGAASVPKPEFRKTSETAKKQGLNCVKYEMYIGDEMQQELWVTEWDNVAGGDEVASAFKAMAAFMGKMLGAMGEMAGGPGNSMMSEEENIFAAIESIEGFPVETRAFENGELESETVLRSAKRQDFDAATFQPPAGYRRQSLSGM